MTAMKARREFNLLLPEVQADEESLKFMEELLGEACRDLRIANYLSRKQIAERMGVTEARVRCIERRTGTSDARGFARVCYPAD